MKKLMLFVAGWILLFAAPVFAARVNSLYTAQVPVTSQSAQEKAQAVPQAFGQVLIKVSGNNQILDNPEIKSRLGAAENLMQEFSYSTPPIPDSAKPYLLEVRFDTEGVNQLLRDAHVPIWGQNRPLILAWIAVEIPAHPAEIVDNGSTNTTALLLKQNAEQRGLPIIFPVMDVAELNQISVKDIATMAAPKLLTAAKRYASNAILIGRISQDINGQNVNQFNTQWKLVLGNDQWSWNVTGKTQAEVLTAITNTIANTLAARYAVIMTNDVQTQFTLKVIGVAQQDDFMQLMNYLKHLTPVADVQLVKISGNEVLLTVSLHGTQDSFVQALSAGQKLTPTVDGTTSSLLVYQWNQ